MPFLIKQFKIRSGLFQLPCDILISRNPESFLQFKLQLTNIGPQINGALHPDLNPGPAFKSTGE